MPELPNRSNLRRGVIRKWLGIDDREFTKLVAAGVLVPRYLFGRGRAYFRRDEVLKAEADGKIFQTERVK